MTLLAHLKRFPSALFAFTAAFCLTPCQADATQVRLTLTGTFDEVAARNASGADDTAAFQAILPFTPGDPVVATVTYDTTAPDTNGNPQTSRFLTGVTRLTIGSTTFETDNLIDVTDSLIDTFRSGSSVGLYVAPGWEFINGGITQSLPHRVTLRDTSGTALPSADLPVGPLGADDFTTLTWEIQSEAQRDPNTIVSPLGSHVGEFHRIAGSFTTLSLTVVPEPSTACLGLLALGVGALPPRRRREG